MTKARFGELQQTLVRAWAGSESFQDGTNLQAWLI